VYKLEHAVRKSDRDISRISWVLSGQVDAILNLGIAPSELSISNLTGKGKGNKGPPYQFLNAHDSRRPNAARVRIVWQMMMPALLIC
jgi:hypothetical protein